MGSFQGSCSFLIGASKPIMYTRASFSLLSFLPASNQLGPFIFTYSTLRRIAPPPRHVMSVFLKHSYGHERDPTCSLFQSPSLLHVTSLPVQAKSIVLLFPRPIVVILRSGYSFFFDPYRLIMNRPVARLSVPTVSLVM